MILAICKNIICYLFEDLCVQQSYNYLNIKLKTKFSQDNSTAETKSILRASLDKRDV